MKKILIIILLLITLPAICKNADSKNYYISADNMFMATLSALNNLHYQINEIQSKSGYILFRAPNNFEYLIMITKTGNTNSNVKIMKLKKAAPLFEIQQAVFNALNTETSSLPTEVK